MDKADLLWKLYEQQMTQAFFHEGQRSSVTSYVLTISSVIVTFIGFDKELTRTDLIPSIFLIVIGLFGAIFNSKNHERFEFHYQRAREFRKMISDQFPEVNIDHILEVARRKTSKEYKFLYNKVSLNKLWVILSILITLIGVSLMLIILI